MVTAKSLQLLDQNSNNISPLVNIETLYYEKTNDDGLVYRNQVFKHFPVYVSYNGEQPVNFLTDDSKQSEFLLYDIINNYNESINKYSYKSKVDISSITSAYHDNINTDILNDQTKLKNNSNSDIIISAIILSRLSNTDYYKLDVSNYNLTEILDNYALESQVYAVNKLLSTKIDNNLLYDSANLEKKARISYKTIDTIGGIESGTDVSTLVGKTYSQLFDELITPIKSPNINDGIITLSKIPTELKISSSVILETYKSDKTSQEMTQSFNFNFTKLDLPYYDDFKMGDESLTQPDIILSDKESYPVVSVAGTDKKIIVSSSDVYKWTGNVKLSLDTKSILINIAKIGLPINSKCNTVYNSIGRETTINDSIVNNANIKIVLNKLDKTVASTNVKLSLITTNNKYNITAYVDIKYPILFGTSISNLTECYIKSGLRYNIIRTVWQPENTFYIAVPLIVVKQIKNNTTDTSSKKYANSVSTSSSSTSESWAPKLYKILQQGRWQPCNNWIITGYSDTVISGFRTYTISGTTTGEQKDIQFIIDTTNFNNEK